MVDPYSTEIRINLVTLYKMFNAGGFKVDWDTGITGARLFTALQGKPAGYTASALLAVTGATSAEVRTGAVLRALGLDVPPNEIVNFFSAMKLEFVERTRSDGSVVNTVMSDWEIMGYAMQRYAGVNPTNIAEYLRDAWRTTGTLSQGEREILESMGLKVDIILEGNTADLPSSIRIPDGLKGLVEYKLWSSTTPPQCFPAGTLIWMSDGSRKPIEAIIPGDLVLSFDGSVACGRGKLEEKRVARVFTGITNEFLILSPEEDW